MSTLSKACFKCGQVKPLPAFYKHKQMADGYLNKCKECARSDARAIRERRIDYWRARDRERGSRQTPEFRRKYYEENKDKIAISRKKWREANKQKRKASNAVNNAVRDGKLIKQPCERCGATDNVHGHHEDYNKPLAVVWLCPVHHGERHKEINEAMRSAAAT